MAKEPMVLVEPDVAVLRCTACGEERPVAEFRSSWMPYYGYQWMVDRRGDPVWKGWMRSCLPCQRVKAAATRAANAAKKRPWWAAIPALRPEQV